MRALIAMACLVLAACGTAPQTPDARVDVQKVYLPGEPVLCKVDIPAAPEWPTDSIKPSDTIFRKMQLALAEIEMRAAYEIKLVAALKKCQ